jgi:orotate phosphoribosyltransferase
MDHHAILEPEHPIAPIAHKAALTLPMTESTRAAFLGLAKARRGHFRLESGHHSGLWLDLDGLFAGADAIAPFVAGLADELRAHAVDVVCGPLVGGAFLAQVLARELRTEFAYTERLPSTSPGMYGARYVLPSAFRARLRGRRVALVDDVMSAGSALRGTYAELRGHGALPVVIGALLILGDLGINFFVQEGLPPVSVLREPYELWPPESCPLCSARQPIAEPGAVSSQ